MKRIILFYLAIFILNLEATEIKEDHLTITTGKIIFISEAPQETIKGIGKQISGDVYFKEKKVNISR